ncbi:hypothetical protein B0H17DRAFT_1216263 [Mycena rosella]|uniref:Uncharacterized protein n=1 Tax=Mycena rosella TaxID=1033263 RepID=A0AAD7CBR1_MYCRO|nr:hypothetical protein B0H17DRAFT_1216263 [Mycena rosella]
MTDFFQSEAPRTFPLDKLAIHDFILEFPHNNRWLTIINLQTLRRLNVARGPMTASFTASFISGIQLPGLEVLELHLRGLEDVSADQFTSCLDPLSFPSHPQLALSDSPPLLSSFHDPHAQLPAYCTGSSIAHLKLSGNGNNATCDTAALSTQLHTIDQEALGLASLELRARYPTIELSRMVTAAFPEFKSLRVVMYIPPRFADIVEWALPLSKNEKTESVIRALAH